MIATADKTYEQYRILWITEVAKLIKARLKVVFPRTKFSVKSSEEGYASMVDVHWTDGPTWDEVRPIADSYVGREFDIVIDMSYYVRSWLLPDGSAQPAYSPGTLGQSGSHAPYAYPKPHPDAELVAFHCYVNCHRYMSGELLTYARAQYERERGKITSLEVVPERKYTTYTMGAHIEGDFDQAMEVYAIAKKVNTTTVDMKKEMATWVR